MSTFIFTTPKYLYKTIENYGYEHLCLLDHCYAAQEILLKNGINLDEIDDSLLLDAFIEAKGV